MISVHLLARDNGAGLSRDLAILARAIAEGGFDLSDFPHVRTWLALVAAQPRHVTMDAAGTEEPAA